MERLTGVDVARGLALLGMMAVHVYPSQDDAGRTTFTHLVASGRASALFAVLAGVGLALLSRRGGAGASVAGRAALVAVIGLVVGTFPSGVAVILTYYGVLFLVALPLLRLGPRLLAALAASAALVTPFVSYALRPHLPARSPGNPSFDLLLTDPFGLLSTLLVTGYYPVLCWTTYLCAGLAVGRLDLASRAVQVRLALSGAVLAGAALAASALLLAAGGTDAIGVADPGVDPAGNRYGNVPTTTLWWLASVGPHSSTPPDLLHTTGTSLLVLGLALLVAPLLGRAVRPLAALGAMTLTLYSVHVLVLSVTDGDTPGLLYGLQVAVFAVFAVLWLRAFPRGPLESVVATALGRSTSPPGSTPGPTRVGAAGTDS